MVLVILCLTIYWHQQKQSGLFISFMEQSFRTSTRCKAPESLFLASNEDSTSSFQLLVFVIAYCQHVYTLHSRRLKLWELLAPCVPFRVVNIVLILHRKNNDHKRDHFTVMTYSLPSSPVVENSGDLIHLSFDVCDRD